MEVGRRCGSLTVIVEGHIKRTQQWLRNLLFACKNDDFDNFKFTTGSSCLVALTYLHGLWLPYKELWAYHGAKFWFIFGPI